MNKAWAFRFAIPMAMVGVCVVGAQQKPNELGFFITSVGSGKGADFGGIEGADKHCQQLAQGAGAGGRTWRAYERRRGQARQCQGPHSRAGPWQNAKGVVVATSVADLHSDSNKLGKENSLSEKGEVVNGRGGDAQPSRHPDRLEPGRDTCRRQPDLQQLDEQRRRQRPGRASRQAGRWGEPELLELSARDQGLQPGQPQRHRRGRVDLLLRGEIRL